MKSLTYLIPLVLPALLFTACGKKQEKEKPKGDVTVRKAAPAQFTDRSENVISDLKKTPFVLIKPSGISLEGVRYVTLGKDFALPPGPTEAALRPLLGAFERARCAVGAGRSLTSGSWVSAGKGMDLLSMKMKACIPKDRFAGDFAIIAHDQTPMALLEQVIDVARKAGFFGVRIGRKDSGGESQYTLISLNHFVHSPRWDGTDNHSAIPENEKVMEKVKVVKPSPSIKKPDAPSPPKWPTRLPKNNGRGVASFLAKNIEAMTSGSTPADLFGHLDDPTADSILGKIPRRFRHKLTSPEYGQAVSLYVSPGGVSIMPETVEKQTGPKAPPVVKLGLPLTPPEVKKLQMTLHEARLAPKNASGAKKGTDQGKLHIARLTIDKKTPYHVVWKVISALRDVPTVPGKPACTLVSPLPTGQKIRETAPPRLDLVSGRCMLSLLAITLVDDVQVALKSDIEKARNSKGSIFGASDDFGGINRRRITLNPDKLAIFGKLNPTEVRAVIRAHQGEVHTCYKKGLKLDEKLAGRVRVTFMIKLDGTPVSCSVMEHLKETAVGNCICARLPKWKFPKPQGGMARVSYPWTFHPSK
ncbi:AgmX/PglI C-terminal domain-containing protein [Myxococcota bacterium]|nr:AgmX/PglI C-terminal domain-containing protein [Myxococcota bacterium]